MSKACHTLGKAVEKTPAGKTALLHPEMPAALQTGN